MARNGCYLSNYASFGQDETHQTESGNGCKKRTLKIQTVSSEFDETVFLCLSIQKIGRKNAAKFLIWNSDNVENNVILQSILH